MVFTWFSYGFPMVSSRLIAQRISQVGYRRSSVRPWALMAWSSSMWEFSIWLWLTSPWRIPDISGGFLMGKSSINIGQQFSMALWNNQRIERFWGFWGLGIAALFGMPWVMWEMFLGWNVMGTTWEQLNNVAVMAVMAVMAEIEMCVWDDLSGCWGKIISGCKRVASWYIV